MNTIKHTLLTSLLIAGAITLHSVETADAKAPVQHKDQFSPLTADKVKLTGHVGQKIDTIIAARYTSDFAWQEVYPEAIAALRQRVDDRLIERRGLWQGEFWGKWMLGAIEAQRYTGDVRLKEFIRNAVREAIATQDANGYIGTYSKPDWVARNTFNVWGMKYTLWALLEAHDLLGDPDTLAAARRLVDYLMTIVGPGKAEIADTGAADGLSSSSILQPLVILYRKTGDQRYLDYAKYVADSLMTTMMSKGLAGEPINGWFPEPEKWAKAYEFMHCVEGLVELYRVTGKADYLRTAQNIAADIMRNERTIVGNVSHNDKFDHARQRPNAYSEGCDGVHWHRLCATLLRETGDVIYAHEMERTLYNTICGALNSNGTWGARRQNLIAPHLVAASHCWLEHHQCCLANMPRGFLQAAESAVMTSGDGVAVNLYLPGTFKSGLPAGGELELVAQTDYPVDGTVNLLVNPDRERDFSIALRIPDWSRQTAVKVNGTPLDGIQPDSYFTITRIWKPGDRIEMTLDMRGRVTRFPDAGKKIAAIERGPVVLARDSVLTDASKTTAAAFEVDKEDYVELKTHPAPVGFWMAFDAPLVGGGAVTLCDYSSVGEVYKQKIKDHYGPAKPGAEKPKVPGLGWLPAGMELFQVWMPTP